MTGDEVGGNTKSTSYSQINYSSVENVSICFFGVSSDEYLCRGVGQSSAASDGKR